MIKKISKNNVRKKQEEGVLTVAGKRKRALAKATIRDGTGSIRINNKPIETFSFLRRLSLLEPLRIAQDVIKDKLNTFDISVNVHGGGIESQMEASRLAIARALVAITKDAELKKAYLNYDRYLLVADVRRKETRKPGDSKARAKRQKSYR
jgi:small subunit ribosomal protein S9